MQLSKREIRLLIVAVVIVISGSLLKWGLLPAVDSYQSLQDQITAAQQKLAEKKRLLKKVEQYKTNLAQAKGKVTAQKKLLFTGSLDQVQIKGLNILEQEIRKSNLEVQNKNIQVRKKKNQKVNLIAYNFTLDGKYKDLISFLGDITRQNKYFLVEKLSVNSRIQRRDNLRINIKCTIISKEGDADE